MHISAAYLDRNKPVIPPTLKLLPSLIRRSDVHEVFFLQSHYLWVFLLPERKWSYVVRPFLRAIETELPPGDSDRFTLAERVVVFQNLETLDYAIVSSWLALDGDSMDSGTSAPHVRVLIDGQASQCEAGP